MKPKTTSRPVFLILLLAIGTLAILQGANNTKSENVNSKNTKTCCNKPQSTTTNNEFIFFESFNRFLIVNKFR